MRGQGLIAIIWAALLALAGCGVMGTEIGNGLKPTPGEEKSDGRHKDGAPAEQQASTASQKGDEAPAKDEVPPENSQAPATTSTKPDSAGGSVPASNTASDKSAPAPASLSSESVFNLLTAPCVSPWSEALAKAPRLERTGGDALVLTATFGAAGATQITSSTGLTRIVIRRDAADLQPVTVSGDGAFAAGFRCSTQTTETGVTALGRANLTRRTMTITDATGSSRIVWYVEAAPEAGKVNLLRVEVTLNSVETAVFEVR